VPRAEGDLERSGGSCGGLGPSSEAGTRLRGCHTLERGGGYVACCLPLEGDGGSPEGCRYWRFDGPLRLFGPFFALDCNYAWRDLWLWVRSFIFVKG
jgi:hypothetical protein